MTTQTIDVKSTETHTEHHAYKSVKNLAFDKPNVTIKQPHLIVAKAANIPTLRTTAAIAERAVVKKRGGRMEKYNDMKHETWNTKHKTYNTQHATRNTQHATRTEQSNEVACAFT